jgi:hypothetical protein
VRGTKDHFVIKSWFTIVWGSVRNSSLFPRHISQKDTSFVFK